MEIASRVLYESLVQRAMCAITNEVGVEVANKKERGHSITRASSDSVVGWLHHNLHGGFYTLPPLKHVEHRPIYQ